MSIPPIQNNPAGPIIRTPFDQESRRAADVLPPQQKQRLVPQLLAPADSFEPASPASPEVQPNAQLRRVAAQQQATYLAPPAPSPAETSGVLTDDTLISHVAPTPPAPPANPTPLPGVIETPVDSPEVVPFAPSQGEPGPEAPTETPTETPSKSRTFNADDLSNLQSLFGKKAGQKGFDAQYDLNGDGVINGADLANLLARFERPSAQPADTPPAPAPEPIKLTSQQLLDGVLKHLGAKVQGDEGIYDVNGDGAINGADIAQVLAQWNQSPAAKTEQSSPASQSRMLNALMSSLGSVAGDGVFSQSLDFNGDGTINGADLAHYLANVRNDEESA